MTLYLQVNTYGALAGYIVGFGLRLLGGEAILKIPPAIKYPLYADGTQNFPFKTMNMLIALGVEIAVSGESVRLSAVESTSESCLYHGHTTSYKKSVVLQQQKYIVP